MTIYLIKKKKNRIYKSENIVPSVLQSEGLTEILYSHAPSGEPLLISEKDKSPCNLSISVSDTKNYWACILSESGDVGIDIEEKTRTVKESVVRKLHALEQQYLSGLQAGSTEWLNEFFAIWTRKEAYSKFCSAGLALGFNRFSVVNRTLEYEDKISCQGRPEAFVSDQSLPFPLYCCVCSAENAGEIYCRVLDNDGLPQVSALTAAASIISVKSASQAEVSAALQKKGYTKEESDEAAAELARRGYIDDSAYAQRKAVLAARSGKSQGLIKRELAAKGLSSEDIERALGNLAEEAEESEFDRALAQAVRICPLPDSETGKPDEKKLAKIARRLSSLGYGPGIIYSILDKYR